MSEPHVVYTARPDASPQAEISALANVYRFVLDCHSTKEATRLGSPDDAKGSKNDRAKHKYTG